MGSAKYEIPFPQADDFGKVAMIANITDEERLKDNKFMVEYLGGITERQISYYLSAAMYIGILNKDKTFTPAGRNLNEMDICSQKVEFIRLLMSDKVFGTAYITGKIYGGLPEKSDVMRIIKDEYPEYSEQIYDRRAQTVLSWLRWIDKQFEE